MLDDITQVFHLDRQPSRTSADAWPWLLVAALMLLFADVVARRLYSTTRADGATHTQAEENQ